MTSALLRRCAIAAITMIAVEGGVSLQAEEPITPIGMLLVNPSAFHRKLLKVKGVVKEVRPYSKYEVTSVCGASFKLTDDTGTIEVSFRQLCQVGQEQATLVNEGSTSLLVNLWDKYLRFYTGTKNHAQKTVDRKANHSVHSRLLQLLGMRKKWLYSIFSSPAAVHRYEEFISLYKEESANEWGQR